MTHTLRLFIVGLITVLLSQSTFAQYITNTSITIDEASTSLVHDGHRNTNVGKTLMFTGASMAMTGLVVGSVGWLANYGSLVGELSTIYTFVGGITGAAVALIGLPFYCAGRHKMSTHGASLMTISNEGQKGRAVAVEASIGMPSYLSLNVTGGYNFNKHLFVGGGVGCGTYLLSEGETYEKENLIVPVYANARLTGGSKCVAPYLNARLGYNVNQLKMYSAIEFGTNIRSASSIEDGAWWIGTKTECLGLELYSIGFTVGKSF